MLKFIKKKNPKQMTATHCLRSRMQLDHRFHHFLVNIICLCPFVALLKVPGIIIQNIIIPKNDTQFSLVQIKKCSYFKVYNFKSFCFLAVTLVLLKFIIIDCITCTDAGLSNNPCCSITNCFVVVLIQFFCSVGPDKTSWLTGC